MTIISVWPGVVTFCHASLFKALWQRVHEKEARVHQFYTFAIDGKGPRDKANVFYDWQEANTFIW